jgi:DNA-binding HxlR family transcriptional regulator
MIARCTQNMIASALYDAPTKPIRLRMSVMLELATTWAISANTPNGVRRSTKVTIRITITWATLTKWLNDANTSGFLSATPIAEMPMKIENSTTAMVEVLRAPVMSRKGFSGMKLRIMPGNERAWAAGSLPCKYAPRATSAALEVRPTAVRPNSLAIRMPISAATVVVSIRVPMVSTLTLPSEEASFSLTMAAMIETMISGMMIICSSLT